MCFRLALFVQLLFINWYNLLVSNLHVPFHVGQLPWRLYFRMETVLDNLLAETGLEVVR